MIVRTLFLLMMIFLFLFSFVAFSLGEYMHFALAAVAGLGFLILGIVLIRQTMKQKIKGRLRTMLLLTGWCATLFFPSVILHNLFYGLGIMSENVWLLKQFMEGIHVIFFLIGTIGCPIGFVIGVVGSMILMRRE